MNWCISTHVNQFLLIHAAVIERDGRAVILPAPPGSGKSTLCAGLIHRGWRLMSDEVTMIPFDGSGIRALVRPVSLKNASIDVIGRFEPSAVFNVPTPNTAKGTVTHMKVPPGQLEQLGDTAQPAWVVFPKWQAGSPALLTSKPKSDTLVDLARNSFNYGVLGRLGFETMADVVTQCECHEFVYSQLDDAVAVFDRLSGRTA
jgi:HprK-related kinase A